MKKYLLLFLMLIPMTAFAQKWDSTYFPADELKGQGEYYAYSYRSAGGDYIVYWSNGTEIKLGTGRGIFDYGDYRFAKVIVGLYEGDDLIERINAEVYVPDGDANTALLTQTSNGGIPSKILDWLNNKGDVRFIISKYGGADFDFRVPQRK